LYPENLKVEAGMGVVAEVRGEKVRIGSGRYLKDSTGFPKGEEAFRKLISEGKTISYVEINGDIKGIIAVADVLKADAVEAVGKLKAMGINTVMITGDNKKTAYAIAQEVAIDQVYAEVMPADKYKIIKELQAKQMKVAMVGDGINDAPALAQANVGIALGSGTDIAIEAADVTIVSGNLMSVVKAVRLSIKTFKKIRQNLIWAYLYNTIIIPVAMLGLLHPVIAEAAMAMSSISVVSNANLLKKSKI
jgi:Cu+-exporting ATPase